MGILVTKRWMPPFHVILALFVIIILVFNIVLYRYHNHAMPSYLQQNSNSPSEGESYLIAPGHRVQSNVDNIDSPEFVDSLTNELVESKKQEIITKLKQEIKKEHEKEYIEALKDSIAKEHGESFKNDLRKAISEDYTNKFFQESERSYKILNDLSADYLLNNQDAIKDFTILSSLNDLVKETPHLADNFDLNEEVSKQLDKYTNRKSYYRYILEDLILGNKPSSEALTNEERGHDLIGQFYRHVKEPPYSHAKLSEHVKLKQSTLDDLQSKHDSLVKSLKTMDLPPSHIAHGDGIIVSGGGVYLAGALVTIGQIREMGARLPVEVIINTEQEYDKHICEVLLPQQFNARCVVIEREIGSDMLERLQLAKFQMKVLGFLVSRFDNVIALDADNLPLKNVDNLISQEPFLTSKFVMWPDIWHKSTSPQYYDIARLKFGEPVSREGIANDWSYFDYIKKNKLKDVSLHDLDNSPPGISVETGQMVFSRKQHFRSLLLALYYNVYGPSHYYRLFFQGAPGEGDRETFLPALHVFEEPYYLVKHDVWLAGFHKKEQNDFFQESTIVQYDALQSQQFFQVWEKWLIKKNMDPRLWPFQDNPYTHKLFDEFRKDNGKFADPVDGKSEIIPYKLPDVFFLHVHRPKINPVLDSAPDGYEGVYTHRSLGLPGVYEESFGSTDWELKFHTISKWVACNGIQSPKFWENVAQMPQSEVCDKVTKYVEFLKSDSQDLKAGKLNYLKFD